MSDSRIMSLGWMRDLPSIKDYQIDQPQVKPMLDKLKAAGSSSAPPTLPGAVDLRAWFSSVEDQGSLGSCTAHAGVGLLEYYERRAYGKHIDASRLFLYKTTRNLLNWKGDTGAYLRSTMEALVLFGVPPESYWPYSIDKFDEEPSSFLYALGSNYQTLKYYRLDPPGTSKSSLLTQIKTNLAAGLPAFFGFTVYSSYTQASVANHGAIPFPTGADRVVGGHAIVVAGYDDTRVIRNTNPGSKPTTGALLIRNSWGSGWGQGGYGWLPYEYVLKGLAVDWWGLISAEWVDTGNFG